MKTKMTFRLICIALALIMCVGFAACHQQTTSIGNEEASTTTNNNNPDKPDDGDHDGGEGDSQLTDDDYFKAFLNAYKNSMDYVGALTVDGSLIQKDSTAETSEIYSSDFKATADGTYDKVVLLLNRTMAGRKHSRLEKIFTLNGEKYAFNEEYNNDVPGYSEYIKYTSGVANLSSFEQVDIREILPYIVGGLDKAESFDELLDAYCNTHIELRKTIPDYIGFTPDDVYALDCELVRGGGKDDEITLQVSTICEIIHNDEKLNSRVTRTFIVADGKITGASVKFVMDANGSSENGSQSRTVEYSLDYKFTYAFDEDYYKSFEVSVPTNPEYVTIEDGRDFTFTIDISGFEVVYAAYGKNADEITSTLKGLVEDGHLTGAVDPSDRPVTVKAFYKDKEMTKKITSENTTVEELLALDKIYAELEVADGYAVVFDKETTVNDISLEYEIVGFQMFRNESGFMSGMVVIADQEINYSMESNNGEKVQLFINGDEISGDSLIPESGKIYLVERVRTITDDCLSVDHVITIGMF